MGTTLPILSPGKSGTKEQMFDVRIEFNKRRHKAILLPKKISVEK